MLCSPSDEAVAQGSGGNMNAALWIWSAISSSSLKGNVPLRLQAREWVVKWKDVYTLGNGHSVVAARLDKKVEFYPLHNTNSYWYNLFLPFVSFMIFWGDLQVITYNTSH